MDENYQTNLDANYFFKLKHSVSRDKSSILMLVRVRYATPWEKYKHIFIIWNICKRKEIYNLDITL